ncbi:(+)-neomenthol dehydrogenase-like [Prunus yedoensis var. nudiflora]|uniref:(+)-neomenthol dehydrogenase-like n=1 Tax=Prunus yedoensis var. nudiflora TaxID=2094558 RepID=A0A314ZEK7_PRUYE|nr:(+)-neomenthol dehydrogenase-like [Prunus yedoensis var. nudiflora]
MLYGHAEIRKKIWNPINNGRAAKKKYAVVTGSNQAIGFGTVRKLASNGIMVVLTALDEKMGVEAIEKLKECGLSDLVVFYQLDVNNAGVRGTIVDPEAMRAAAAAGIGRDGVGVNWSEIMTQTYELAEVCVKTNYYGAKKMTKALLPLLQLSDSPRVVSLSSGMGSLKVRRFFIFLASHQVVVSIFTS